MFIPKQIVLFNNSHDAKIANERKRNADASKQLGIIMKKRLYKLNLLIYQLIRLIEESGWIYDVNRFVYRSDFKYDSKRQDIVFAVNEIVRSDIHYVPKNNTDLEIIFEKEYHDALDKLVLLEQKRDKIINYQNTSKVDDTIIDFTNAKRKKEWQKTDEFINEYTIEQANYFVDHYGLEGIFKLVNLLNDFDKKDSIMVYNKLIREDIPFDYKSCLLNWIVTYSNSYYSLYNKCSKAKDNENPNYQVPDIEEIRLRFITRL